MKPQLATQLSFVHVEEISLDDAGASKRCNRGSHSLFENNRCYHSAERRVDESQEMQELSFLHWIAQCPVLVCRQAL